MGERIDDVDGRVNKVDNRLWVIITGIALLLGTQILGILITLAINGHIE
jgi:hypothetical protein